jgi:hypothetical protein
LLARREVQKLAAESGDVEAPGEPD